MPLSTTIKFSCFDFKSSWKTVSLKSLGEKVQSGLDGNLFLIGDQALYINSRVYFDGGNFSYWHCLDVEDRFNHGSIAANLEAAKDLLILLDENGLTEGLIILLSGHGFRFVWPWVVPMEWKRAFSGWIRNEPCIDDGVNLGNKFFRMAGYRGNSKQGKDPQDIHIEALPDFNDLYFLTEADYKFMIQGKPSALEDTSWLNSILPKQVHLPINWQVFLEEYKVKADLAASIWMPEYLPEVSTIDHGELWRQAAAYLDETDNRYTERQVSDYTIHRLKFCPSCGKRTGGPYITHNGRLKCHRATCDAGQRDEEGKIIGLAPHEWIPDYKAVHIDSDDQGDDDTGYNSVEEIRERFATAAQETDIDQLFTGDPGTGKTHAVINAHVQRCDKSLVVYAVPRHALGEEITEKARQFAGGRDDINISHISGRNEYNCLQWELVEQIQSKGYSPGVMVCPTCRSKFGPCEYNEQFKALKKPGFIVAAHAQVCSMDLNKAKVDTLIVDEDSLPHFFNHDSVKLDDIMKFSAGYPGDEFEKISNALNRIYSAAEQNQRVFGSNDRRYTNEAPKGSRWENTKSLWDEAGIDAEGRDRLSRHLAGYSQFVDEKKGRWMWRLYNDGVNYAAIMWLWVALGDVAGQGFTYAIINFKPGKKKPLIEFIRFYKDIPAYDGQIITLDGTGSKPEVDSLFNRDFQEVPGRLKIDCQKALVQIGLGKVKAEKIQKEKPATLRRLARSAIAHLRPQDQKVLIATHKVIEDHMLTVFQGLLPGRVVESIHFYGNRGVNEFKDFDAVICFGGPGTNQAARLDEAMVLFPEHEDQLKWFEQKATAELIQTVQRVRLSFGDKNLILVHRKWIPELGPLKARVDSRKGSDKITNSIEKAYQRVRRFYKTYGFCTLETLIALGVGHISKKKLISKVMVLSIVHLYKYILIGERPSKMPPLKPEIILFQNNEFMGKLIEKLEAEFPGQRYEKKAYSSDGAQWSKAYGRIDAAQIFYLMVGKEFNHDDWRKI